MNFSVSTEHALAMSMVSSPFSLPTLLLSFALAMILSSMSVKFLT